MKKLSKDYVENELSYIKSAFDGIDAILMNALNFARLQPGAEGMVAELIDGAKIFARVMSERTGNLWGEVEMADVVEDDKNGKS